MWPAILLLLYCALVALASLAGGALPALMKMTHRRMQLMMSFVGGLMLGVALLHFIPHAWEKTRSIDVVMYGALAGLLFMFFLIRALHVHHHAPPASEDHSGHDHGGHDHSGHDHSDQQQDDHAQGEHADHSHSDSTEHCEAHQHEMSWVGLLVGMSVHSLLDGVALAAGVLVEADHASPLSLAGLAVFLAVFLHKPLDSLSITSVMTAGGWTGGWNRAINVGFALVCPLGAALFAVGVQFAEGSIAQVLGIALAFSAGVFLCLSLADLLPELRFHSHDRLALSVALLLGVAIAAATGFFEGEGAHGEGGHDDHPPGAHPHGAHPPGEVEADQP